MTALALDIRQLEVGYAGADGIVPAVEDFSLSIAPGEFVGLAGEVQAAASPPSHRRSFACCEHPE